jgi:carboxylesterase
MIRSISLLFMLLVLDSCTQDPDITNTMLDSKFVYDPSLDNPEDYLLSYAKPNPTPEEAARPVFIVIHGYSASTFEWEEFRAWSGQTQDYFISSVLMGGHGRTYEDFKKATWQDWQTSIEVEYNRLVAAGYQNLNFIGSSTSCALLLNMLSSGFFATSGVVPRQVMLVDPIVIPADKTLSLVPVVGPILGYIESDNTAEEDRYWYHYRPQETLQQLNKAITHVRKQLQSGISLPANCSMKVYKSIKDPSADPVSAVLIHKGVRTFTGNRIEVAMIDSHLHVFTRLALRDNVTPVDIQNQQNAFNDFVSRVQ